MTLPADSLWLYAIAMIGIWFTPGPVWVAIIARALASGFRGVWPLSVGVLIGDALWPLIAIFGLAVIVSQNAMLIDAMRWIAAGVFIGMGILLLRKASQPVERDSRLTRRGTWAGFSAGLLAIAGNPKAALFYVGVLPGFFDVTTLSGPDITVIVLMSCLIPFCLNLGMGGAIAAARSRLSSPTGLRRMNLVSGGLLITVGCVIGLGQALAG